ncbi:MAG: gamma-glutamyl-phosphate reductase, partial [Dehalococcoidia bacterium]|nr:gamma-glutamyl-phosphate reductase [Dehalococcoidia bacterium]
MMKTMTDELAHKGEAARIAARQLAKVSGGVRNQALLNIADCVVDEQDTILDANRIDLDAGRQKGLPEYYLDRMMLDLERLEAIASDVRSVASLPDPVGEVIEMRSMPNGLQVGRRRVPLGVVGVIYESRPNVTVDISTLCLKSGNAVILRGGSDTINSNTALADVIRQAVAEAGAPEN